jgi:hypothetical protein
MIKSRRRYIPLIGQDGSSGRGDGWAITAPFFSIVNEREVAANTKGGKNETSMGAFTTVAFHHLKHERRRE